MNIKIKVLDGYLMKFESSLLKDTKPNRASACQDWSSSVLKSTVGEMLTLDNVVWACV